MALLALLHRLAHPAELVGVLAGLDGRTLVLEGAEDIVRSIVLRKVVLLRLEGLGLLGELALGGVAGVASGGELLRFGLRPLVFGEDAI